MPHVRIYHNPRCSKSRKTLDLLNDYNINPNIIDYLNNPPTTAELRTLLTQLNMTARDLVRQGEPLCKELNLKEADDTTLLTAMSTHPILIERPIVVKGNRAVIGRPPENVMELIHE